MPITVVCPECETSYQLQPDLVGKTFVCKNTVCRHSFVIPGPAATNANWWENQPTARGPAPVPTPTPPAPPPVAPQPTPAPRVPLGQAATGNPTAPPPVRRQPGARTATPRQSDTATQPPSEQPTAEPVPTPTPPVTSTPATPPVEKSPPGPTPAKPRKPRGGVWAKRAILGLVALVPIVLGLVGWWVLVMVGQNEERLAKEARESLTSGNHVRAISEYGHLAKSFSRSPHKAEYEALEKLADRLAQIEKPDVPIDQTLLGVKKYLAEFSRDAHVEPFFAQLGTVVEKRLKSYTSSAIPVKDASPGEHLPLIREVIDRLTRLKPPGLTTAQETALKKDSDQLEDAVKKWALRNDFEQAVSKLVQEPGSGAQKLRDLRKLIEATEVNLPGLRNEPKMLEIRNQLFQGQLSRIVYNRGTGDAAPSAEPEPPGNLWVQARLQRPHPNDLRPGDDIVLALARGVLYALRRADGQVVWTRRVGVDTTALPVRVPGDEANPGRILVLSADRALLTALDRDGRPLWQHSLGEPCLGRPVIVDHRAFLATARGIVQEIELTRGRLLGTFDLGQRLTLGGVREQGTSRLYFAADDSCVYVIDVHPDRRRCVAVLQSGHPSGSLRAAPILLPGQVPEEPGYLVLTLTRGLTETGLAVFQLPDLTGDALERALPSIPEDARDFWLVGDEARVPLQRAWARNTPRPDIRLPGWTWFPPAVDPEKIAFLTEEGQVGLIGIRQPLNQDPLLFPLLPIDEKPTNGNGTARGRTQVVRMLGDDLWLLSQGKLRRSRLVYDRLRGPKLEPSWPRAVDLGEPLHLSQSFPDPRHQAGPILDGNEFENDRFEGRAILYIVTQPLDRPGVMVSAVEDETGRVLWQTQLGLVAATEPLRLQPEVGPATLLVMDQAGALYRLPSELAAEELPTWQGHDALLADSLPDNPHWSPRLVPLEGGAAVQVAVPGDGRKILLRRVFWDTERKAWSVEVHTVALPDKTTLAGHGTVVAGHLILPLSDGNLHRLPIPVGTSPVLQPGPRWRDRYLGTEATAHLVSIGGDRFVSSDGLRGLTVWEWPAVGKGFVSLPPNREVIAGYEQPTYRLQRPIAPAGVLRFLAGSESKPSQLLVPCRDGTLLALSPKPDGKLELRKTWDLGGLPTDGPYPATPPGEPLRLCTIVQESRLAWLDPETDTLTLWKPGEDGETLMGRPRRQGDRVWASTEAGRVLTFDPTQDPRTATITEVFADKGSIAPASTPVLLTPADKPARLLLPLTDGTLRVLMPK